MASTLLVLIVSALCGVGFGYAAQRGSLCVISGIETVLAGRSPRVFLSFLRCSVCVLAVTLPIAWLMPGDQLAPVRSPMMLIAVGGLMFGVGAAINGGCAFGTLIRLGSGDASFLATLAGLGIGLILYQNWWGPEQTQAVTQSSPLERVTPASVAVLVAALAFCLREAVRVRWRTLETRRWPPERAALVMGVTGGVLYALNGSWAYTVAIERGLDTMMQGGIPTANLAMIFVASLAGAAVAATEGHRLKLRLNAHAIPNHLLGGTVMGLGAAVIPGGNDALVLHDLPALSLHAPVAYFALAIGAAATLSLGARWRGRGQSDQSLPGARE